MVENSQCSKLIARCVQDVSDNDVKRKPFLTMSTSLTQIRDICITEDTLEVTAKITRKWYSRHLKTDALMSMDIILLDENIYPSSEIKEIASFIKGEPLTKEVQLIRKENEIFDVKAETMTVEEVKRQRSTAKIRYRGYVQNLWKSLLSSHFSVLEKFPVVPFIS
ncbi:hypothetical protein Sjap_020314 [Stephania japonica]|uniref:Uncharacterized protein n=1 Tax=Stephania japonica TaxID=461633 RepID=A0AAP0F0F0_9MAGN